MLAPVDERRPEAAADDSRRWWVCGAKIWHARILYPASTGRSALAQYRRDLIDAERANGCSIRDATELVRAVGVCILAGPLSTDQAREYELGWALAWAICDNRKQAEVPRSPATVADAVAWLSIREIAVIGADVERIFTP